MPQEGVMPTSKDGLVAAVAELFRQAKAAGYSVEDIYSAAAMAVPGSYAPPSKVTGIATERGIAALAGAEAFVRSLGKEPADVVTALQSQDVNDYAARLAARRGAA
jgi:hypothetical protein